MKASKFYISTFKEAPSDAELISHQLMIRAGLIKRLGSGLYSWMPMGLKILKKIEDFKHLYTTTSYQIGTST